MSEEPQKEQSPSENVAISEGVLSYMLGLVDTSTLVKLVLKSFKPGSEIFNDFIDNCTKDTKFRKLFVFDLPQSVTEEMIRNSFSTYGDIEDVRLVTDTATNRPKGYGFIVFASAVGALKALSAETSIGDSVVHLKYAIANTNPPRPSENGPEQNLGESLKLHVKGFPITWTNEDIASFFTKIGPIQEAFICYEKGTQISRGFGFVTFVSKEDYDKCLKDGTIPGDGFEIHCSPISLSKSDDRFRRSRNDRRYDDRRYDDRRYDDRRYDDRRYDDRRYDDRRYDDRRSRFDDHRDHHDRSRDRQEDSRDNYRSSYNYQRYNRYGYPPQQEYVGSNYSPYHQGYDAYPPSSYSVQSNYPYTQSSSPQENNQSQANYDPSYYPPSGYWVVC